MTDRISHSPGVPATSVFLCSNDPSGELLEKYETLKKYLKSLESAAVAFSVDFQKFLNLTTNAKRKILKITRISAVFLAEIRVLCYSLFRFKQT